MSMHRLDPVSRTLLALQGGDEFARVIDAADKHREQHVHDCGLHPAGPMVMGLVGAFVRVAGPRRLLDLGCGFGYSSLWLAAHAPADACVDAVDRFAEHVEQAERFAAEEGFARKITFHAAEADAYLRTTRQSYDFIHDDAWFAKAPSYLEAMLSRLRTGGVLTMANWFLLIDALSGDTQRDWGVYGGPSWRADTLAYARQLAAHPQLEVWWVVNPPLGVAVKR
jgi:predicted O-methyltransferase YrrM